MQRREILSSNQPVTDEDLEIMLADLEAESIAIHQSEITGLYIDPQQLANNKILKRLCLTDGKIDQTTIDPLAQALARNTTLTHLDLSGNNLGNEGVEVLLNKLSSNPNSRLESLDLSNNKIDRLSPEIIRQLFLNQTLKEFILDHNVLRPDDCNLNKTLSHLFKALGANHSLTYLSLQHAAIDSKHDLPLLGILTNSLNRNTDLITLGLFKKEFSLATSKDKKESIETISKQFRNQPRICPSLLFAPNARPQKKFARLPAPRVNGYTQK